MHHAVNMDDIGSNPISTVMKDKEYLSNRQKSQIPKKRMFWCKCDKNHVGQHGKCEVCGWIANKKKKK